MMNMAVHSFYSKVISLAPSVLSVSLSHSPFYLVFVVVVGGGGGGLF